MKIDKKYTHVNVCPVTNKMLPAFYMLDIPPVCPNCGHDSGEGQWHHYKRVVGKWVRPSFLEWLRGSRKKFYPNGRESNKAL